MKKRNKKLLAVMTTTVLTMGMATSVFAAVSWDDFEVKLPKNTKDTEVSTVKRSKGPKTKKFKVVIESIGNGYTAVCAWTESTSGKNYSSPNKQIAQGTTKIKYSEIPEKGKNVVLNLDNPVKTTNTPTVKGKWTPN